MSKRRKAPRGHWLNDNRASRRPKYILFFDTEALIESVDDRCEVHDFRLAVACLCRYTKDEGLVEEGWATFEDPALLWHTVALVASDVEKLLIVSHNIDYDARISKAFTCLPKEGYSPTQTIISHSCTVFDWENDGTKVTLIDNRNLWRNSLLQLGESIGVPKLEVDFKTCGPHELEVYCKRDVEILVRLWQEWFTFLDEHDLGNFGFTAARQSFNAYRHRFMEKRIGIHKRPDAAALERDAYRGGRTECFKVGKFGSGPFYKLDVNGLYATMMAAYRYPCNIQGVLRKVSQSYLRKLLDEYLVIAQVVVTASDPVYVKRMKGRNCYPTGTFMTTLTTPELKRALDRNEIRGIGTVAIYEGGDLFSKYVRYFQTLRLQYKCDGNNVGQEMCKLFLNSLQGKFGQRGYEQKEVGTGLPAEVWTRKAYDADTREESRYVCFGGKVFLQWQEGEGRNAFPAIPAHVSAYGRLYMWNLVLRAGRDHVFYMDTDSLIVDQEGYDRLADVMHPTKLGYLKLEGIAEDLEIHAKKDYRFGRKRVLKGIKKDAKRLAASVYEQWQFTTLKYALRDCNLEGVKLFKVIKHVRGGYLAGTVADDGTVKPPKAHLTAPKLFEYLDRSDIHNRSVWCFDPTWLEGRQDVAFHQERRDLEEWWHGFLEWLQTLSSSLPGPSASPQPVPVVYV